MAFGLKQLQLAKDDIETRVDKYLKLMQIDQFKDRKPENLSGGQQRVALARALAISPDVLLMDEPLSNLDAKLRLDMRQAIKEIQREVGIATLYVTHDQEEAMAISDQIAVMNLGKIQQIGKPKEPITVQAMDLLRPLSAVPILFQLAWCMRKDKPTCVLRQAIKLPFQHLLT